MMGVTKAPDVWAAGVPIVPFVNWFTEIANEDPVLQQSDLATMGDPEKNKELFHDRSPIFFVDQIKAPLLLLAGGNDPRCPKEEAQQVVDAVKKRGGVVEYKVYENEGHGFAEWKIRSTPTGASPTFSRPASPQPTAAVRSPSKNVGASVLARAYINAWRTCRKSRRHSSADARSAARFHNPRPDRRGCT